VIQLSGADDGSGWAYVVRRAPASVILDYLAHQWNCYSTEYGGVGEPFEERSEPELTEGFAAYLQEKSDQQLQPFDGNFFAEQNRYDLRSDGKRKIIARTDIEWRLYGSPAFVVEFKIIGNNRPAKAYVLEGMMRFVEGRYAPQSLEGAMWAFFHPTSNEDETDLSAAIQKNLGQLRLQIQHGLHLIAPSKIAPNTAKFDSIHHRDPYAPDIRLAHVLIKLTSTNT